MKMKTTGSSLFICLLLVYSCTTAVAAYAPEVPEDQAVILQTPTTAPRITYALSDQVAQKYIVRIDPIGLHKTGETITITGTTNLPGTPGIWVDIICTHALTAKSMVLPCTSTSGEAVTLQEQTDGFKRWYFIVNTTDFAPDQYLVEAGQAAGLPGERAAYDDETFFLLSPETARAIEQMPVRIDPAPSHPMNESMLLQGTVSDYTGENLTLTLIPGQYLPGGPWLPENGKVDSNGISGIIQVLPQSNGTNPWTFKIATKGLDQGVYAIEIESEAGEPEIRH